MSSSTFTSVLQVEDSPTDALLTREELAHWPQFRLTQVDRLEEALRVVATGQYAAVLLDLGLPDSQGLDTLVRFHREAPNVAVIVMTAQDDEELALRAVQAGAQDYLVKGRSREHLLERTLRYAIERDLTRRALREQEELFRGAFEHTNVAMVLTDLNHRFVRLNAAFAEMFGYSAAELLQLSMLDITHPDDLVASVARREPLLSGAAHFFQMEKRYLHKDGHVFWALTNVSLLRDAGGKPLLYFGQVQDITERKRAEAESRRTADLLLAVAEGTTDAVFVKDREGKYLLFNESAAGFVGRPVADVLGKDDTSLFDSASARLLMERDLQVMESGRIETEEETLTAAGITRTFLATKGPYRDEKGNVAGVLGISRDITDRKRTEEALRQSELLKAAIVESALDCIVTMDTAGRIVEFNAAAERTFGYARAAVLGKTVAEMLIPPAFRERHAIGLAHYLATGEGPVLGRRLELSGLRADGTEFPVEISISPLQIGGRRHFTAFLRDLTERQRLEEQFRQSQKMEAVGRLAGGVAHDFNNLLTVISGYSEVLLDSLPPHDQARDLLKEIQKAGARAATLTRQLLAFSRKQVLETKVLDLNAVVTDSEKMLHRVVGEDIDLAIVLNPALGHVKTDPGQVEQVLMNLVVNARDAMPQGGKITIGTANVNLDETYRSSHADVKPGRYVMLSVSDSGCGMDEQTKARIFEPFFTTKESGKGTGLGLAMVHGFITQSGGHVFVYSEPGIGTTFKIYLPEVKSVQSLSKSRPEILQMPRGNETILLVEDEAAVRALARYILQSCGYLVLEAANGDEAIRLAEKQPSVIHLLVSDVVMPGMSGRQVAERVATFAPEIKVLYVSGYTDDAVVRHGILESETDFLQKPFTPSALAVKVREVLDR
jgi:PAS domain S-box-containing protein